MNILNIIEVNEDEGRITICGLELGLGVVETWRQLEQNGYKTAHGRITNATVVWFPNNFFPASLGEKLDSASVIFLHSMASPYINNYVKISINLLRKSPELYSMLWGFFNDFIVDIDKCFHDKDDDVIYVALKWKDYYITAHVVDETRYVINISKGYGTFFLCDDMHTLACGSEE